MDDVKVLERRELGVRRQWTFDEELDLSATRPQSVAGVDAQFLTHAFDHATDFRLEVLRVVYHVEVRMPNPGCGRFVIEFSGQLNAFRPTRVFFRRVEILGAVCRRNHVDDLIVPVVSEFDVVPSVRGHHQFPLVLRYN